MRTRSVGTKIRPTFVSRPSILTLRANASRTRSSLLLATRRTKKFMVGSVSVAVTVAKACQSYGTVLGEGPAAEPLGSLRFNAGTIARSAAADGVAAVAED